MYKIIGADGREYGPISAEQLRQWLAQGRVNAQTKIQSEGGAGWKNLDDLPDFSGLVKSGAASLPPIMSPAAQPSSGGGINVIIPYKNIRALTAYYLAVFSLIPFVGIFLGLTAFVLGILGLRFCRQNPATGGVVHAWIGIVLGGLCGFGYLALTIFVIFAAMAKRH